ncbi:MULTISPECIES: hypothetical protein [Holdemania]|uniref:hypothetical protein n=1 Tax=Holdemania TaxID=61170 RepID=UPI001898A8DD|nr:MULTISPECIES: hypothetical protein [Holdemania]
MKINEQDVAIFGAHLTMDYTVGGYEVDSSAFMGRKRSTFVLLNHTTGFKEIVVPIVFDKKPVTVNKDRFEALAFSGKVELEMDDGQLFTAYLSEIGETTYIHPDLIESEYVFIGVRHGRKRTVHANTLFCESTLPWTDCILTVTVGKTGKNYQIGPVVFPSVTSGQVLVVDGINKRILANGAPAAELAEWTVLPSLSPGLNAIDCADPLTVEYYPAYF